MSGIAGIVDFRGGQPERAWLQAMETAQGGRVDPGAPTHRVGPVALKGPMRIGEDLLMQGDLSLFEADALGARLQKAGVSTDPRQGHLGLLAAGWHTWGDGLLQRLNADFALAIWNPREQVLHLARDRSGARPLYYCWLGGKLAFASDLRGLLALPWVSAELAREHLAEQLAFRYVHAPRTLLRDIRQLPAGAVARVDQGGVRLRRWHVARMSAPDAEEPPEKEVQARLESLLERAVARRLGSDSPGLLLSGGGASSCILGLAVQSGPVRSFNVAFADGGQDEASFAGRIARIHGSEHNLIRLTRHDFLRALEPAIAASNTPLQTPAAIVQWLLMEQASSVCSTVLSGDGADELFGGSRVEELMRELRAAGVVANLPTGLRGSLGRVMGPRGSKFLVGPEGFGLERHVGGSNIFGTVGRKALLRDPSLVRSGIRRQMLEPLYREVISDPINEVLHVYQRGWLTHNSLPRAEQPAAALGISMRFPLLDPELLDFLDQLPGRAKVKRRMGRWHSKWPLKQLTAKQLPPRLNWRPKRRMPAPQNRWLRGDGESFLWERVSLLCEDPHRLFRADAIRKLAREHAAGDADHGPKLWTLFFFDAWLRSLN